MNAHLLTHITEFGNFLVLGAISITLCLYFIMIGLRREALAIFLGYVTPIAVIGVLKISFYTCNTDLFGVVSPSGHAAISMGVLGMAALILVKISRGVWKAIVPLCLIALAIIIGMSRVILGMHTLPDVILGFLIGTVIIVTISKIILTYQSNRISYSPKAFHFFIFVLLLICGVGISYGVHLPSEDLMRSVAEKLRLNLEPCDPPL